MWEELEKYRNHFLQHEIKDVMKPSSINCQQNKGKLSPPRTALPIDHSLYRMGQIYEET